MKLQNRLALSYTAAFALLLGITFTAIYYISNASRVSDFHRHFRDKTLISFRLLIDLHDLGDSVLEKMDKSIVNGVRENTVLFDSAGWLVYNTTDAPTTSYTNELLQKMLRKNSNELFMNIPNGELLALKMVVRDKTYIGIAKAENRLGKERMRFLALLLWVSFLLCLGLLAGLSFYLSRRIIRPVARLAREIGNISPGRLSVRVAHKEGKGEVAVLTAKFNEMLEKVEDAFKFERQAISHLSHELKTPLAVMMTKIETALLDNTTDELKECMLFQRNAVIAFSNIIDTMLEISKRENEKGVYTDVVRVDELVFECFDELLLLNKNVRFDFKAEQFMEHSHRIGVKGNSRMLKLAFYNLLRNAVNYSTDYTAKILLDTTEQHIQVSFVNNGATLTEDEARHLFSNPFRGAGSRNITGVGLGLTLTHRIIAMHDGTLEYRITSEGENCFDLKFKVVSQFEI